MEKDQLESVKKKFVKILVEDINQIRKIIEEKYFEVNNNIEDAKKSDATSSIDFNIFKDLINEICFDNLSHTEKRQFSQISNTKPKFYDDIVYDIPENRLNVFIELFEVKTCIASIPSELYEISFSSIKAEELYYLFFFSLFHRLINSNKTIEQILNKLLSEWQTALNTKKILILFNIFLDRILIKNNYKNQKLQVKKIFHTETTRLSPYKASIYIPNFLVFETEIPLFIYETNDKFEKRNNREDYEIVKQMGKKFEKFKNFLCALYFHDYYLPNPHPIIKLPWWGEPEYQYLNKFYKKKDSKFIYKEIRRLTETEFNNILKTYSLLEEKGFYNRSCLPLLFSVKNLAFSEPFNLERIFYAHTLLEFLFSPRPPIELSFKIPLNASLLISDSYNEFHQNFIFLREMYNIRSKAIHGDDWYITINKTINKLEKNKFQIKNIIELFKKFEELIRKILNKILTFNTIDSQILELLEKSNITSFRIKKYQYLIKLGGYYEKEEMYTQSLKIFFEVLNTAQLLDDSSKILESEKKIKQIYNLDDNISLYQNELNLILSELSLLSKFNDKKQKISREIQDKFSELRFKIKSQTTEKTIRLVLNGNEIMKEFDLEQGPIIGKIKLLMIEKIKAGELKNNKEDLLTFLKKIDLSSLD